MNTVHNSHCECAHSRNLRVEPKLPSSSQLLGSSYSKLQWKHTYVKAVNNFWSKQLVSEIKTKKSLKYLPVDNLRIGSTHLVWRSLDSTVSDVRKGITKARILTGTYLLQKNQEFIQWWKSRSGMPPMSIGG